MDRAAECVDFDLKEVSFTDAQGVLNQTRYTQPCMVAFAAGMTAVLAQRGILPAAAAGLSLGEYSALHAAGVFDDVTAVRLVAFRGKAMEEAAAGHASAMMAVLGLDRKPLQEACDAASALGCAVIANYNCPGQLVIGGDAAAVELAAVLAKEAGARRCLPLKVSGPFHTPLMAPAGFRDRQHGTDAASAGRAQFFFTDGNGKHRDVSALGEVAHPARAVIGGVGSEENHTGFAGLRCAANAVLAEFGAACTFGKPQQAKKVFFQIRFHRPPPSALAARHTAWPESLLQRHAPAPLISGRASGSPYWGRDRHRVRISLR